MIVRLESTTSTMEIAAALAARGAPHGTVVVAEHQSAGIGRHGPIDTCRAGRAGFAAAELEPEPPSRAYPMAAAPSANMSAEHRERIAVELGLLRMIPPFLDVAFAPDRV